METWNIYEELGEAGTDAEDYQWKDEHEAPNLDTSSSVAVIQARRMQEFGTGMGARGMGMGMGGGSMGGQAGWPAAGKQGGGRGPGGPAKGRGKGGPGKGKGKGQGGKGNKGGRGKATRGRRLRLPRLQRGRRLAERRLQQGQGARRHRPRLLRLQGGGGWQPENEGGFLFFNTAGSGRGASRMGNPWY